MAHPLWLRTLTLPRMGEIEVPPRRMGRRVVTMPDEPPSVSKDPET